MSIAKAAQAQLDKAGVLSTILCFWRLTLQQEDDIDMMQLFAGLMERNGNRGSLNICSRARAYMAFLTEQIELQAKLLNYFLGSNKSNINQSLTMWCIACESEWCCLSLVYLLWRVITRIVRGNCIGNT